MADHITNTFYITSLLDEISSLKEDLLQTQKDLGLVQRSRQRYRDEVERLRIELDVCNATKLHKLATRRFMFLTPLIIAMLWLGPWEFSKQPKQPVYSCSVRSVNAQNKDSLEEIVKRNCSGEVDKVLSILVAMYGTDILQNETIYLPVFSPHPKNNKS